MWLPPRGPSARRSCPVLRPARGLRLPPVSPMPTARPSSPPSRHLPLKPQLSWTPRCSSSFASPPPSFASLMPRLPSASTPAPASPPRPSPCSIPSGASADHASSSRHSSVPPSSHPSVPWSFPLISAAVPPCASCRWRCQPRASRSVSRPALSSSGTWRAPIPSSAALGCAARGRRPARAASAWPDRRLRFSWPCSACSGLRYWWWMRSAPPFARGESPSRT
mmetsp:Transcript_31628/g.94617  ORF Transcript_31628/g.94617 Transcript_31628/m.94617 type:complete len:223 (+) Transcript_31628:1994-2662(+)